MSSDSSDDVDEFFDAPEVTPSSSDERSYQTVDALPTTPKQKVVTLSDLEEEKRRLLELKKAADERRRQEEELLQRGLDEIERRQSEELEKQKAEQKLLDEAKGRRRKLEEMRRTVEQGITSPRHSVKSGNGLRDCPQIVRVPFSKDINSTYSPLSSERRGSDNTTGEASLLTPVRILELRSSSAEDIPLLTSSLHAAQLTGIASVGRESSSLPRNTSLRCSLIEHNNLASRQSNNDSPMMENAFTANDSVAICRNHFGNQNIDGVYAGKITTEKYATGEDERAEEPDIIQSTKSSGGSAKGTLVQTPSARPVAPPRRKNKNNGNTEMRNTLPANFKGNNKGKEDDDDVNHEGRVTNLTLALARTFSLPGAEEGVAPVLDMRSATKGVRIVTASEDITVKSPYCGHASDISFGRIEGPDGEEYDYPVIDDDSTYMLNNMREEDDVDINQAASEENTDDMMMTVAVNVPGTIGDNSNHSVPLNINRPRSHSGSRYLTDQEVLDQVYVVNLDTGESLPLSSAEEKLPKCINPLSLHIMRRTKEYQSDSNLQKVIAQDRSDDESLKDPEAVSMPKAAKPVGKRKAKLKRLIGKTVNKIKSKADGVFRGDDSPSDDDEAMDGRRIFRVKAAHGYKGPYDFDMLVPVQELCGQKTSAVWTMKFSHCGRLLATGGQDNVLRVWIIKDAFIYFDEMRQKYSNEAARVSPAVSYENLASQELNDSPSDLSERGSRKVDGGLGNSAGEIGSQESLNAEHAPFMKEPFYVYRGHAADLLDISWSKNYFILSSSMDKTVRLWHVSRKECLCCFQHIDFVTAIAFHPKDDRYFLSGSLDGKLRLWNIPDKKVALWNEVMGTTKLITAANFCLNGRFAVVGTYDGRCLFYSTEHLKYFTQIHVHSTRGKNARGRKITGVEPYPGEDKVLVTSNDSRIRLYDLRDLTLTCKYKGCVNNSSQIKASLSHDGKYIVCGSEDRFVYIWKTQHETSGRRDRNGFWESIKAHNAVVTNAIFAPVPELIIKNNFEFMDAEDKDATSGTRGEVLISADYLGAIKVFINKFKPSVV